MSSRTLGRITLALLAAAAIQPNAHAQAKPTSQQQTEDRIKKLEERTDATEQRAAKAEMQKDYIERTQADAKAYYDKAFNSQIIILSILGVIIGLVGKFGGDHIVASKLSETSA